MSTRFVMPTADVGVGISPPDGAKLFFTATGTNDDLDTFSDAALTTANANPVIADSAGVFPDIFLGSSSVYRVTLKNKNNVQTGFGVADPVSASAILTEVDTIAAMTAIGTPTNGDKIRVHGYAALGDNQVRNYRWDSSSTATVNGGTIIAHDTITPGRFLAEFDNITVKDFGAKGAKGGGGDDTTAIQAAFDYAKLLTTTLSKVEFPTDSYNITAKVICKDAGIIGNGSIIISSLNHSLLQIEGNNLSFDDLRLQYTAATSNTSRIALTLTDGTVQASKNTYTNIVTRNAFNGFFNDGGTGANGSIFGSVFINCRADKSWDWGWNLDCALGATTLTFINCDNAGDLSIGTTQSKGFFINNCQEVIMKNVAIDQVSDGDALKIINALTVDWDVITLESCFITTDNKPMITVNGGFLRAGSIQYKSCSLLVGAGDGAKSCDILQLGSTSPKADIGFIEEFAPFAASVGTVFKIRSSSATKIRSRWVDSSESDLLGESELFADHSRFTGGSGNSPNIAPGVYTRAHTVGQWVSNSGPAKGEPFGWVCTVAGTPGTWESFGIINGGQEETATTTEFADISNSVNTTGKWAGKQLVDTTTNLIMVATGSGTSSTWQPSDGGSVTTPV